MSTYEVGNGKSTGTAPNNRQFLTKEQDKTGLVYFGKRYYNPSIGRFITPDPSGMADGPNLYVYCNNDPINYVDLWGLSQDRAEPWWEKGIDWWFWESVVPGPYGAPVSERGLSANPITLGDPLKYTEAAGGGWMWAERTAFGISVAATAVAVGAIGYEIVTGKAILVEGVKGTRIIQVRPEGGTPWIRVDYGPVPKMGGKRLPHWHGPNGTKHLPWELFQ